MNIMEIQALARVLAPALSRLSARVKAVESIGAGRNGVDGKNGEDGLGIEDLEEDIEDGGRFLIRRYRHGDRVKEFRHQTAMVVDRGVYVATRTYEKGDGVTWAGSFWIAKDATNEKPGDGATKWRLAVKAGRDGREGKQGSPGPQGLKGDRGEAGRNFT
jgi:integrin beta 3